LWALTSRRESPKARLIEIADTQIAPSQERLVIAKLQNPGAGGFPRGIVLLLLKIDGEKDFLQDIFGLLPVAKDLVGLCQKRFDSGDETARRSIHRSRRKPRPIRLHRLQKGDQNGEAIVVFR
jgi:hypothetical protein